MEQSSGDVCSSCCCSHWQGRAAHCRKLLTSVQSKGCLPLDLLLNRREDRSVHLQLGAQPQQSRGTFDVSSAGSPPAGKSPAASLARPTPSRFPVTSCAAPDDVIPGGSAPAGAAASEAVVLS